MKFYHKLISLNNTLFFVAPWTSWGRKLTLSVSCVRYAKIKATNPISELPLTCFLWCSREFIVSSSFIYRGSASRPNVSGFRYTTA